MTETFFATSSNAQPYDPAFPYVFDDVTRA